MKYWRTVGTDFLTIHYLFTTHDPIHHPHDTKRIVVLEFFGEQGLGEVLIANGARETLDGIGAN